MSSPVAVVTGASRGVGFAVTRLLIDGGYRVHAQYHRKPADFSHERLSWWQADLRAPLDEGTPALERVDALVHCAGVCTLGTCADTPRSEWEEHMAVNLHGPVELTAALLPALRTARGHVVYINSGAGKHANPNWGTYAASKFAARAWCDALRQEEKNISVTGIFPGRVATDMQKAIVKQEERVYDPTDFLAPETVARSVLHAIGTPKDGQIHEIVLRPR